MSRAISILVGVAATLAFVSAAARAAPAEVRAGALSGPHPDPVAAAEAYVARRAGPLAAAPSAPLVRRFALRRADGALVRHEQTHAGLPVRGGTVAVRTDAAGRVRWVRSSVLAIPPGFATAPAIDAAAARARLGAPAGAARLVVHALGDHPRLAWEVDLPPGRAGLAPRGWVDATTGEVLGVVDRALRAGEANVFLENPVTTPDLSPVTLPLPDGATTPSGLDVDVVSCIDDKTCSAYEGYYLHLCGFTSHATTDAAAGHAFTGYGRPASDADPADGFAEVQLYHHLATAFAGFRAIAGDPSFALTARPLLAVANGLMPDIYSSDELLCDGPTRPDAPDLRPFENAFFVPAGAFGDFAGGAALLFLGQGMALDFAYDGEVVAHELTHAVFDELADIGKAVRDPHGTDSSPGGISEGIADYFAAAIYEDPLLGEYIAWDLAIGGVRTAANDARCPDDLVGQSHRDAPIFSGALWEARGALLPEERALFDRAVFTAGAALGPTDGFASFSAILVAETEVLLGADATATVTAVLGARGLTDCGPRVISLAWDEAHPVVALAPGHATPVQFRLELPEVAGAIRLDLVRSGYGSGLALLAKPGDEPIRWTGTTSDAPWSVPLSSSFGADQTVLTFPAPVGPGPVHLQLDRSGDGSDHEYLYDLRFTHAPPATPPPDAGPPPDARPPADAYEPMLGGDDDGGGCGCQAGGRGGGGAGSLLVILALAGTTLRRSGGPARGAVRGRR